MFSILVDDAAFILGDNQSVLVNSPMLESTLRQKFWSIAYHVECEERAEDELRTRYIHFDINATHRGEDGGIW